MKIVERILGAGLIVAGILGATKWLALNIVFVVVGILLAAGLVRRFVFGDPAAQSFYVRECQNCGYVLADPGGKLDPMRYNSWCPKCKSSHMAYRAATELERKKVKKKQIDVYKS